MGEQRWAHIRLNVKPNKVETHILAAAFSLVIVMLANVDRPGEGFMRVCQHPIADVRQSMLVDSP